MIDEGGSEGGNTHTFARERRDIVLEENWNAMQRPACTMLLPLDVQELRLLKRSGVCLEHCTQCRSLQVDFLYSRKVSLRDRFRDRFRVAKDFRTEHTHLDEVDTREVSSFKPGLQFRN